MKTSPQDTYRVTEVMTAPPQKLHLMLIEAAIRFAHKARRDWAAGEDGPACESLIRAQEIVGEMLAGLNREADGGLAKRVAAVYLFVFRSLMEASYRRDEAKLADALRILEIERETWRGVCQRLGVAPRDGAVAESRPSAPVSAAIDPAAGSACGSRLSLDA